MANEMAVKKASFIDYVSGESVQSYLAKVLGNRKNTFVTSLASIVAGNDKLKQCDPNTLLGAAIKSAAIGLPIEPGVGRAYIIPYWNGQRQVYEAQFQIGYKGLIDLALRTGQIKALNAIEIRDGEFMGRDDIGEPKIRFLDESDRLDKEVIGYMAAMKLRGGMKKVVYWPLEKVNAHAGRFSQGYRAFLKKGGKRNVVSGLGDSPWEGDFDKMACKTVLKNLLSTYAPVSPEMADAFAADQAVLRVDTETLDVTPDYVDNTDVRPLTLEEQKNYIETYGKEAVGRAVQAVGRKALSEVTSDQFDAFNEAVAE